MYKTIRMISKISNRKSNINGYRKLNYIDKKVHIVMCVWYSVSLFCLFHFKYYYLFIYLFGGGGVFYYIV